MKKIENNTVFYYKNDKTTLDNSKSVTSLNGNYELWYFLEDKSEFLLNATTYFPKKNTLIIVKPNTYHKLLTKNSGYILISFSLSDICENFIKDINDICSYSIFYKDTAFTDIFNNLSLLKGVMSSQDFSSFLYNTVQNIILQLKYTASCYSDIKQVQTFPTLTSILEYIDNNLNSEDLTIYAIADALYISPSTISHIFTKGLQISPQKYINNKKMIYAKSLINSGIAATEVAKICGYSNYVTFYRLYKQFFNISPSKN